MRILFLTSRLPYPPHRGDRVRTFNFLKAFASRHDVHLISFIENNDEREAAVELESICSRELVLLGKRRSLFNITSRALSPMPYQALYYRSARMQALVQAAFADGAFDLIYVHLFRMAPFVAPLLGRRSLGVASNTRAVLDLTDSVASEIELSIRHRPVLARLPYVLESRKIRAYEARIMPSFDEIWVISEADREDVLSGTSGARVEIVPNGVDERLFDIGSSMCDSREVVFVGNLSVPHNIDAVELLIRDIMPRLRTAEPEATLRVVGQGAGDRVRGICAAADWCNFTGFVPDLRDAYRRAAVFAAPMRFAAGVQNKMLEAMAAGVPVVTTPTGNRGLKAAPESEIVVASGAAEFARALGEILSNAGRRDALSRAGRQFVSSRFEWSHALERAETVAERS